MLQPSVAKTASRPPRTGVGKVSKRHPLKFPDGEGRGEGGSGGAGRWVFGWVEGWEGGRGGR